MTALTLAEKSAARDDAPNERDNKSAAKSQRKTILVAAVSTLITGVVLLGIFGGCVAYWYNNNVQNRHSSEEWIFWNRLTGNVTIHESALLNEEEQTALMISAEAYKIHGDNSLALHDFKTGFVALRDFNADMCFVTTIPFPDFVTLKKTVEGRQGKQLQLQPLKRVRSRKNTMTSSTLGPKLTEFCNGVPAHWFDEISDKEHGRRFRRQSRPTLPESILLCYYYAFEIQLEKYIGF